MRQVFAVFGHPVAHSRSPRIHAAFAAQAGIDLAYARIDAAPDRFAAALAAFAREGGRGANVTLPHKAAALALCATLAPRALRAGAVNTLLRIDDDDDDGAAGAARWHGDNTDGAGLVRDLQDRHGVRLAGLHVLLLGAGGAAAGVAPALLDAGVAGLSIANRGTERLQALVRHLDDRRAVAWGAGRGPDDRCDVAGARGFAGAGIAGHALAGDIDPADAADVRGSADAGEAAGAHGARMDAAGAPAEAPPPATRGAQDPLVSVAAVPRDAPTAVHARTASPACRDAPGDGARARPPSGWHCATRG